MADLGKLLNIIVENIVEASQVIDKVFLDSRQLLSDALSQRMDAQVLLKVECLNPIRSFKGRGTDYYAYRHPGTEPLVCASAGNFGQGIAYAARKHRRQAIIFAAENANPAKLKSMRQLGADVRLGGEDFDQAKIFCREFADAQGIPMIEDGRQPEIAEGAGTIALELCRWPDPIDVCLIPVGNGALINGMGHWFKVHSPQTKVIGVCAEQAPSMKLSWEAGKIVETELADTIADGIAVRVPIPEALQEMNEVVDDMFVVSENEIAQASRLLMEKADILVEPSGAVTLAAALKHQEIFRGKLVAVILSGANLTKEQIDNLNA